MYQLERKHLIDWLAELEAAIMTSFGDETTMLMTLQSDVLARLDELDRTTDKQYLPAA